MSENKRYVAIDHEEVYYITDTDGLKTLDDFIKEFSKSEYEFTEDEILSAANEAYWEMIYENSMTAKENVDELNDLYEERNYFERKKEEFLSKWSIAHSENTQLRKENKDLEKEVLEQEHRKWACIKEAHRLDLENEQLKEENQKLKEQLKNCTEKAKEEIRKQEEENAIRWANIGR